MTNHLKVYLNFFGLSYEEFIPCLLCGKKASEIHHIIPRSQTFGSDRDNIENLAALCNDCHYMIHNIRSPKEYKEELLKKQIELINKTKNNPQ